MLQEIELNGTNHLLNKTYVNQTTNNKNLIYGH